jgi:hypothetical protein
LSWSIIVSWYGDCHSPACPRLCVEPHEPRLARPGLPRDEVLSGGNELVVAGFHALARERPRVLDPLLADLAPARVDRLVVLVRGPAVQHAAWAEVLSEVRELRLGWVVRHLGLFLGVEVIEVAEELVEAMVGRQHVVQVAEVVLAELTSGVPLLLEQRRDGDDLLRHADRRARQADLRQPGAIHALAGDERSAPGGAALLAVRIREHHPFLREPVDVGRVIAHQTVRIATQIRDADVVAPEHEDVGLAASSCCLPASGWSLLCHGYLLAPSQRPQLIVRIQRLLFSAFRARSISFICVLEGCRAQR